MKKLSKKQKEVIHLLQNNENYYIHKSIYYNHNEIYDNKGNSLMQFKRPTFDFLLKNNYIVNLYGEKYGYNFKMN